jgi:hypothetical protein
MSSPPAKEGSAGVAVNADAHKGGRKMIMNSKKESKKRNKQTLLFSFITLPNEEFGIIIMTQARDQFRNTICHKMKKEIKAKPSPVTKGTWGV